MSYIDESQVEIMTVEYFRELGYEYIHGPGIAPDGEAPERADYGQVVLTTKAFFAKVQNKLHFAIHGHTAAELIMQRANSATEHMGWTRGNFYQYFNVLEADFSGLSPAELVVGFVDD